MIGVRKYLLAELRRDSLDGTVVVDCDRYTALRSAYCTVYVRRPHVWSQVLWLWVTTHVVPALLSVACIASQSLLGRLFNTPH
jgi:hypothetical protein